MDESLKVMDAANSSRAREISQLLGRKASHDGTPQPKFMQLKNHFMKQLESGELKPGVLMPSEQQLAKQFRISRPTVRLALAELEREGLVKRISDPNDERVQRVTATRKGRRVLEMGRRRRVAALTAEVARLSSRDRRVLARAAELLRRFALPPNATRDDR